MSFSCVCVPAVTGLSSAFSIHAVVWLPAVVDISSSVPSVSAIVPSVAGVPAVFSTNAVV
jgi:hypothetical protein